MVEETFVDLQADTSPVSFTGWRCVICGAIVDALIAQHQIVRPKPHVHQTRARKPLIRCG
jgi:hypothetical protein